MEKLRGWEGSQGGDDQAGRRQRLEAGLRATYTPTYSGCRRGEVTHVAARDTSCRRGCYWRVD